MLRPLVIVSSVFVLTSCLGGWVEAPRTLSAGDLSREYFQSKAGTRNKYDGRPILVHGCATGTARLPDTEVAEGLIILGEEHGQVRCWFTRKEMERFRHIRAGKCVTVEGIFNGESGTELRFCRLAAVE